MATGRPRPKDLRVYIGGFDLNAYTMTIGPLAEVFAHDSQAALADAINGGYSGQSTTSVGTLNGFFDNTATSGLHVLHEAGSGSAHIISVAIGIRAAPVDGDPAFLGSWLQNSYQVSGEGVTVPATIEFGDSDITAAHVPYSTSWGFVSHASGAETAVNGATGLDDNGASSAFGGFAVLHGLAGNGTATVSIEHSAVNADGNFDSTGDIIAFSEVDFSTPFSAIAVAATTTTTINRYTRWQVSLNTATTLTFVVTMVRGRGV